MSKILVFGIKALATTFLDSVKESNKWQSLLFVYTLPLELRLENSTEYCWKAYYTADSD